MLKISKPIETLKGTSDPEFLLESLAQQWEDAKALELTANQRRLNIEQQLAELLPAPEEGQKSHKTGPYRIVRTNVLNYTSPDLAKLVALSKELDIPSLIKDALSETAVKRLRREDRLDFDLLVGEGVLAVKAGKPRFEISRVAVADTAGIEKAA